MEEMDEALLRLESSTGLSGSYENAAHQRVIVSSSVGDTSHATTDTDVQWVVSGSRTDIPSQ